MVCNLLKCIYLGYNRFRCLIMSSKCKYFWKNQSGVAVKYLKCGRTNLNEKLPLVYFIIPGNPGCVRFYEDFADSLHQKTNIPVWGISHTGHSKLPSVGPPENLEKQKFQQPDREEAALQKQIEIKVDFLQKEVFPVAEKVVLVGHSIGCYIIIQIMEKIQEKYPEKVKKGVLLFPTIEKMQWTPQGKKLTPILTNARWLFMFAGMVASYTPPWVFRRIYPGLSKEEFVYETIEENFPSMEVLDCITYMGLQEMYMVDRRDDNLVEKFLDRLIFYYGSHDEWCPIEFYENLDAKYGHVTGSHIEVAEQGIPHAFVLTHSHRVAEKVAEWSEEFEGKSLENKSQDFEII
nr:lipid droplet-associated hydrolase [Ciona intestinalis]|eukprot:XP_026690937.1 lipid droplet-associated hydrolase [Ciona intestinalis]